MSSVRKTKYSKASETNSNSCSESSNSFFKIEKSKPPVSRSFKAGLIFPVSRIDRLLREGRYVKNLSAEAPVFLAAVLEYLVLEILELSLNICKQNKRQKITPQFINWSINNDLELNNIFKNVTIASGGVFPQPISFPTSKSLLTMKPSDKKDKKNIKGKNFVNISRIIKNKLKQDHGFNYIGKDVSMLLTGVLYYCLKELITISIHTSILNDKYIITPKLLHLSIKSDKEFKRLLSSVIILNGGFVKKYNFKYDNNNK